MKIFFPWIWILLHTVVLHAFVTCIFILSCLYTSILIYLLFYWYSVTLFWNEILNNVSIKYLVLFHIEDSCLSVFEYFPAFGVSKCLSVIDLVIICKINPVPISFFSLGPFWKFLFCIQHFTILFWFSVFRSCNLQPSRGLRNLIGELFVLYFFCLHFGADAGPWWNQMNPFHSSCEL